MTQFLDILRGGDWLTLARTRLWALAVLVAAAGGLLYLVATSDGLMDYQDRPLGTDFSNVYAAGTYVLEGKPAAPFDPRLQYAREREIFGEKTPFYGWHYPPFFLWLAAALALMPPRRGAHSSPSPNTPACMCWRPARPGGTRSRACSQWPACGAHPSRSPTPYRARSPSWLRARWSAVALVGVLRPQGRSAVSRRCSGNAL